MAEAYVLDAVRTPVGKRGGALSTVHPADLGAHVIRAIVERTGVDPELVEDVIWARRRATSRGRRGSRPGTRSTCRG